MLICILKIVIESPADIAAGGDYFRYIPIESNIDNPVLLHDIGIVAIGGTDRVCQIRLDLPINAAVMIPVIEIIACQLNIAEGDVEIKLLGNIRTILAI